ncbi:peptidase domain-containing ABC transporter [Agarivorans sp. Toyoura001]|uniref:peptidase domain-containing ABC transporter n=1 Tax=Agarivorans sp. Toyoura001 TaxID=2283141 RepID=UPI0010F9BABA|nr:type I secretion system permease/ATPase [Agarivorans sp. Toyoura001]
MSDYGINNSVVNCCSLLCNLNGNTTKFIQRVKHSQSLGKLLEDISIQSGVKFVSSSLSFRKLKQTNPPLAFKSDDGEYALLAKISSKEALVQFNNSKSPAVISLNELSSLWTGKIIYEKKSSKFDLSWFIPEFIKYRKLLGEVLFLSVFIQVLALFLPLFFQVVMDKVMIHNALATLDVLVLTLVIVGVFEVVIKGLRDYLFIHTTNRVDINLGLKLFEHLLRLPMSFFKSRQVGVIVTRVKELDSIRNLLTGGALTLLVDISFVFLFILILFYLSSSLAMIVLCLIPIYPLLAWCTAKPLKHRIEKQFEYGAVNTAFLTESIHGSETAKSLAIEPIFQRKWELQTKKLVEANFSMQKLQSCVSQFVNFFQRLSSVLIIWIGSTMVMNLEMTIGQLIAFNMIATHVNQPMAKLVELWHQFVQTKVSVEKLSDVLNIPSELEGQHFFPESKVIKKIEFRDIKFRYTPKSPLVLNNVNLSISHGESVGIVGPSGSGKSTFTRLIQKLYPAEKGLILLDGHLINNVSSTYIRKQIGVVLQENYLFSLSVRENIAIKHPSVEFEQVVKVAKLAGAHEFIVKLSNGYDTIIAEGGSSLSGGQKQRIAIARALVGEPSILIFDEATSALDDETQQIVQKNMAKICEHKTVITVAHRLSTVKYCDRILYMENGYISEQGTHAELLALNGAYSNLWKMQRQALAGAA